MKKSIFSLKIKFFIFIVNFLTLLIIGVSQYSYQLDSLRDEFNFNIENIIKKEFSNNISVTKGVITSLTSFYHSADDMNTSSFSSFTKDLVSNYDFIKSVGFVSVVKDEERDSFEEMMRDEGLYNFQINSFNAQENKFSKSEKKDIYGPIIYMEPASYKYTRYYGFDIFNQKQFHKDFLLASKENSIKVIDNVYNERNEAIHVFVKASYNNDLDEKNRLNSLNGFFIIDIDIDKLLNNLKRKFGNYYIKIIDKNQYEEYLKIKLSKEDRLFKELVYLSKIEDFSNSYFYIKKNINYLDFNLKTFFMILLLVVIIQVLYVLIWQRDRYSKDKLNYEASHDDLTGLINRTHFRSTFEKKIHKIKNNKNTLTAVLFIDLDRFKEINDSFGHSFGDDVLIEIANRFKEVMRNNDTICRHGGDEFIILVEGIKDLKDLLEIVKKIMNSMNPAIRYNKQKIYLTLSMGISLYPNDGKDIDDLLKNADSALYKAKDEGRNNFRFYTEDMTLEVMQKVVLENKIRDAITNDDFVVYYQPQYDGKTDKLIGMEALVRWMDKDQGLVAPNNFIPLCEETGLIVKLDQLVMKKAIKDFSSWTKQGLSPCSLSLNLSMKQLKSYNFISILKETIIMNNCNSSDIELEVTEGQIMENPLESIEKLKEINSLGIKLSIDDFGTGYSSLAYLKKLPIDKLKIDRTFVKDLPDDEEDIAISKSVIALAQNLKLDVIAEGVETKEQKDFLVKNGCSKIQGYYYSKPLSRNDMQELLEKIKQ